MIPYVARRIAGGAGVLLVTSFAIFVLMHLAPGDPAVVLAGPDAGPQTVEAIRRSLGLDRPLLVQYFDWITGVLSGDLGQSYALKRPVAELVGQRWGSTVQLTVSAGLLMLVAGALVGILLGTTRSRTLEQVIDYLSNLALSLPAFVSGVILIFVFAVVLHALPSGGDVSILDEPASSVRRLLLPSIAMALPVVPVISRLLATEMRRVYDQEYVLTAIAKGASARRITWLHVLPNSLGATVVEMGIRVGHLIGGAVVVEAIFARAGLGSLLIQSVENRDYPLAQVLLLIAIGAAIVCQLVAEVVIGCLDPRIRLKANS